MRPVLQLALDFVDLPRALQVAEEAVAGGVDWLEAGTPLIKSEGLQAVRELHSRWPQLTIVADMKTMDAGRAEVEYAAKAGARVVGVLGAASDATIRECIEAARNYGAEIVVDMVQVPDVVARAVAVEAMGASYIGIHVAIDEQMQGKTPFDTLREVAQAVSIPVAVAGGINSETAGMAVEAGASIVVVGGAITKATDAAAAARAIKGAMETLEVVRSDYFVRATGPDLLDVLRRVSAANVSDAMHRSGDIPGLRPITPGSKLVGPALTVRTYPGDWCKPVEAIDQSKPGDVLVIDAGGVGPAVWGELATNSAIQRGPRRRGHLRCSPRQWRHPRTRLSAVLHAGHTYRRRTQGVRRDRGPHPHLRCEDLIGRLGDRRRRRRLRHPPGKVHGVRKPSDGCPREGEPASQGDPGGKHLEPGRLPSTLGKALEERPPRNGMFLSVGWWGK